MATNPTNGDYKMPVTNSRYSNQVYAAGYLNNLRPDQFMGEVTSPWMNRDNPDGGYSKWDEWFNPQKVQDYQFAQEMMAKDYENWYNSPAQQMQRMREAGINPNTAAAAIAGNPSQMGDATAGAVPQSASFGEVTGTAQALTGAARDIAESYKVTEEGKNVTPLAGSTIDRNNAEIEKWSYENRFTEAQTDALRIDIRTLDARNRADLNVKRQQYNVMVKQADHIQAQRDYIQKQIDRFDEQIDAELDLSKKRSLEAEKHAFLMEEQTRTEKMENDFAEQFGYRRDMPFDAAMLSMWFNGDYDMVKKTQDFMWNLKYGMANAETEGSQTAIQNHAFNIANAQETARSLNSIITDWSQPASGLWSFIDKSFNVTGNKKDANVVPNAQAALTNPDAYRGFTDFLLGLQLSLDSINQEMEAASSRNEFNRIRELAKQRDGLMKFMKEITFEEYSKHRYGEE